MITDDGLCLLYPDRTLERAKIPPVAYQQLVKKTSQSILRDDDLFWAGGASSMS